MRRVEESKMKIYAKLLCGTALAVSMLGSASAANLDKVGISVGSLGNPFFVATIKGITDKAKSINPNVQVISVSSDYDLNKQATQMDNFIAAGVNVIMLNAVDPKAIARQSSAPTRPASSSRPSTSARRARTSPS